MIEIYKFAVSLIPVLAFLTALVVLDSYKLVSLKYILVTILAGCVAAILSLLANSWLIGGLGLDLKSFSKYIAPGVEELFKSLYLIFLFKIKRIGFTVDATIYGFAIGAGFGLVENIYYLHALTNTNIILWILRGFGTAVMHGSTVALMSMISKIMTDRRNSANILLFFPGLLTAILIHTIFNLFILPPAYSMLVILTVFPALVVIVFIRSEKTTGEWLGIGMDADVELLETITSGKVLSSNIGRYLDSLKTRFSGVIVGDMLCYLRIYLELAVGAKGLLMMRSAGFNISIDSEVKSKLEELKFLEKSIGRTGKLALLPFLQSSSRDAWQLYLLGK